MLTAFFHTDQVRFSLDSTITSTTHNFASTQEFVDELKLASMAVCTVESQLKAVMSWEVRSVNGSPRNISDCADIGAWCGCMAGRLRFADV